MPVACVCVRACVGIYIYTKPREQKFRAMNGAQLASPIRGELGYAHGHQLGTQFIACSYWAPNLGSIRETICLPVWYENLSGVVSCLENSNINTDGLYSVVIGSRDQ